MCFDVITYSFSHFQEKTAIVGDTTLCAVKWYDNRSVTLLSDYVGAHPVTHVQRWDRGSKAVIDVPCPAVVRDYNQHMGGVDLLDSLIALYRTKIRSKKWYHRLFFHFLDMIVVTCWMLYKRDCKCNNLSDAEVMRLYAGAGYQAAKALRKLNAWCNAHLCFTSTTNCFLNFRVRT